MISYSDLEKQKHQKAEDYKSLCLITSDVAQGKKVNLPDGWVLRDTRYIRESNFKAATFQNGKDFVSCFAGTDPKNIKDQGANLKMGVLEKPSKQMKEAIKYLQYIKEKVPFVSNLISAGHSEGGTESIVSSLVCDVQSVTFNAFMPSFNLLQNVADSEHKNLNTSLVTNYRDPLDPVSKLKNPDVGTTYIVENNWHKMMATSPFGYKKAHALKNMGNCQNAILKNEYKEINPRFMDKILNVQFTHSDVKDISDAGLFDTYESELMSRLQNNNIVPDDFARMQAFSGDLIYVDGYVRADGTEVRGYFRHRA
ncbi:MAG: hypothetical protein PHV37_08540 [Candidatus Gastranaerophilales bacterium]|nr:hypothetical protein [Candidatus Gastranaerophilales bacterium]